MEELKRSIKEYMDERNLVSIFFRLDGGKHVATCNVQCLNAAISKKFSKKNWKILEKYVSIQKV